MRPIVLVAVAAILAAPATAQPQPRPQPTTVFGAGRWSCAKWQSEAQNKLQGEVWILGALSALNGAAVDADATALQVGNGTDADGALGEVARICRESPSLRLYFATKALS